MRIYPGILAALMATGGVQGTVFAQNLTGDWIDRVDMSGTIEVEGYFGEDFASNGDRGDITLATVELGLDAEINDIVSGHILFLHEDDDTEGPELDEGTIRMDFDPFYLSAGRMYVPFGLYESHMITDPLTLELGETRESALLLGVDAGGIYGSVYFYNGDTNEASSVAKGDDTVDQMGFSVGMMLEASDVEMDLGFDYMSNIADSDLIEGVVAPTVQDYVSAFGLHGSATFGPFMVLAEIVNASDFNTADLAFNSVGAEPFAMALEGAFYTNLLGYDSSIAVGYQYTDEAVGLGLPETRFLVGLGMEIMEQTNLSFEYRYDEDYETGDGGSGNDGNTFTTQLAVLF